MSKQCQSCGMPLVNNRGDHRGTEADGSKSDTYCSLCYEGGAWTTPDTTLDEMKTIVDQALKKQHWPKPMRWLAQSQLPKLKRWRTPK